MNERIISAHTGSLVKLKDAAEMISCIAKGGFHYFDLTMAWENAANNVLTRADWQEEVKRLKDHAESLGMKCTQTHLFYCRGTDEETIQKRIDLMSRGILVTKAMGASIAVAHPMWELPMEDNVVFFKRLLPLLKKENIKIAIENVWGVKNDRPSVMCSSRPELLEELLNRLDDEHFVACLDIGHAEMGELHTSALDFVKVLDNKIKTVHIHDNVKEWDLHQIPFIHKIDFISIFEALKEAGYEGPVNFEVGGCFNTFPVALFPSVLRLLKEIGEYFASILDS